MKSPVTSPVDGKALRFAPARERGSERPAFSIWKVSAEGSEVYAMARTFGGNIKLSVHERGQIHLSLAPKKKQILAPPMRIGTGVWMHAVELRFLRSDDSLKPPDQLKSLKKKKRT